MRDFHTFVDRNLILYQAVEACSSEDGEGITAKDIERLDKHGLKSSVLDGIPPWLKKWAALICEFIEYEQNTFGETEEGKALHPLVLADELKNLKDAKLANIAITINKVAHLLAQLETDEPPIRKMSSQEVFIALWLDPDSAKNNLVQVLETIDKPNDEVDYCFEYLSTVD